LRVRTTNDNTGRAPCRAYQRDRGKCG